MALNLIGGDALFVAGWISVAVAAAYSVRKARKLAGSRTRGARREAVDEPAAGAAQGQSGATSAAAYSHQIEKPPVESMSADLASLARGLRPTGAKAGDAPAEAGPPLISCDEALDSALVNLNGAIAKAGAVIYRGPLPAVPAESRELAQVFEYLVGNAVRNCSGAAPLIRISSDENRLCWRLSVRDNGKAIEPENFGCEFDPDRNIRTGEEAPGAGADLAACYALAERMGGTMWAMSSPEGGALISISLSKDRAFRKERVTTVEEAVSDVARV